MKVSKSSIIFKKLDEHLEKTEEDNPGFGMSGLAIWGIINSDKNYATEIDAYFDYTPEAWEFVKNYSPQKLMRFLSRVIRSANLIKKQEKQKKEE